MFADARPIPEQYHEARWWYRDKECWMTQYAWVLEVSPLPPPPPMAHGLIKLPADGLLAPRLLDLVLSSGFDYRPLQIG
jgi:hypothetical protein